jgi:hypothetical protein
VETVPRLRGLPSGTPGVFLRHLGAEPDGTVNHN